MFENQAYKNSSLTNARITEIQDTATVLQSVINEVSKVIVGQDDVIHFIVVAMLCNGHILLEGVPGVAKTTMIKAITKSLGLHFNRIQFTPDLMPADVIGTLIFNIKTQEFETKKGPIFANLILADEINRAPAKVQSALLEAMQERQVTIGSTTFSLEKPFLVFATQNPLEQEGTYRLPEAQVDRFMFKLTVSYPSLNQERDIIKKNMAHQEVTAVVTADDIFKAQHLVDAVYLDDSLVEYILHIVFATREPAKYGMKELQQYIQYGVSPRATLALHQAARAHALLKQRHFVIPDDIKAVAYHVLCHRMVLSYHAEAQQVSAHDIVRTILNTLVSP